MDPKFKIEDTDVDDWETWLDNKDFKPPEGPKQQDGKLIANMEKDPRTKVTGDDLKKSSITCVGQIVMKFKHFSGKINCYMGTATLVGQVDPDKYIIISVAHNFKLSDHVLVDAVFVVHREGSSST